MPRFFKISYTLIQIYFLKGDRSKILFQYLIFSVTCAEMEGIRKQEEKLNNRNCATKIGKGSFLR